ncbi:hypothetical protein Vadar_000744 [Vaccinium darrowii]|uniref:Uncharacterized protein n=1 Tax=Vaccinium darrowii TaxID=229202 RepID=A0ACB7XNJ2_9ERIC|nr:hypothetical protein Vadar_000744 [Vaccinium darrowii]
MIEEKRFIFLLHFITAIEEQQNLQWTNISQVVFLGLRIVTPLISLDLLKYPKLCHNYFSSICRRSSQYHSVDILSWDFNTISELQNTLGLQSSTLVSHEYQGDQQNNGTEAPVGDSSSISTSSHGNRKVSWEDIEFYGRSWKKRMLTFQAYYIRHKLKKQIILFNNLLQHQSRFRPLFNFRSLFRRVSEDSHVHDHSLLSITLPACVGVGSCTNLFPADIL